MELVKMVFVTDRFILIHDYVVFRDLHTCIILFLSNIIFILKLFTSNTMLRFVFMNNNKNTFTAIVLMKFSEFFFNNTF